MFTALPELNDNQQQPEYNGLNIEQEQAEVFDALQPLINSGQVCLQMPDDGQFESLRQTLHQSKPHVLFLSCHGQFVARPHDKNSISAHLLFEDEYGAQMPICATALSALLTQSTVQCVVLSACESAKTSSENLTDGLAQQLFYSGIPYVIGMKESLLEVTGHLFARHFCHHLGNLTNHGNTTTVLDAIQNARDGIANDTIANDTIANYAIANDTAPSQAPDAIVHPFTSSELVQNQWSLPIIYSIARPTPMVLPCLPAPPSTTKSVTFEPRNLIGRRREIHALLQKLSTSPMLLCGLAGQGKTALADKLEVKWQQKNRRVMQLGTDNQSILLSALNNKQYAKAQTLIIIDVDAEHHFGQCLPNWLLHRLGTSIPLPPLLLICRKPPKRWPLQRVFFINGLSEQDFTRLAIKHWPQGIYHQQSITTLHQQLAGNPQGLLYFCGEMTQFDELSFNAALTTARQKLLNHMAVSSVFGQLTQTEQNLLYGISLFDNSVPLSAIESLIQKLDITATEDDVKQLIRMSLVIKQFDAYRQCEVYHCPTIIKHQVIKQKPPTQDALQHAGDCQQALFIQSKLMQNKPDITQAIVVYRALQKAQLFELAVKFALEHIIDYLNDVGFYHSLISHWLPALEQTQNPQLKCQILGHKGKTLYLIGEYEAALNAQKRSVELAKQLNDKTTIDDGLNNQALVYQAQGQYEQALECLLQSEAISRTINPTRLAITQNNLAQLYKRQGKHAKARHYLEQALQAQIKDGSTQEQARTLNNIAQLDKSTGDLDSALSLLKQAQPLASQSDDKVAQAAILNNFAQIFDVRCEYDAAQAYYADAAAIYSQIGDKANSATILNNLSQLYFSRADYDSALDHLFDALALQQSIGAQASMATTLSNIGKACVATAAYDRALRYFNQAQVLQEAFDDKQGLGVTLNNQAVICHAKGQLDEALLLLQQALDLLTDIDDKANISSTLNNMALIAKAKGDNDSALRCFEQCLTQVRALNDKATEGCIVNNIAQIYDTIGDYDTALHYLEQAYVLHKAIGDKAGMATLYNNVALNYAAQQDYANTLVYFQKALAIQEAIDDKAGQALSLSNIAISYYLALDEHDNALHCLDSALNIREQIGDSAGAQRTLENINKVKQMAS